MLVGTSVITFLLDSSKASVVAGHEAGVEFNNEVEAGNKANLAPPHVLIFLAFMEALMAELAEVAFEGKTELQAYLAEVGAAGTSNLLEDLLLVFRLKDAFHREEDTAPQQTKIHFAIDPLPLAEPGSLAYRGPELAYKFKLWLVTALGKANGERKRGPPPRGVMERAIQAQLRSHQRKTAGGE